MSPITKTITDPTDFLLDSVKEEAASSQNLFEPEDESTQAPRSSTLQAGWGAALKAANAGSGGKYTEEFKFSAEHKLVKFISNEPFATYKQHWIERAGKKSFNCLGDECPLCNDLGDIPKAKTAFSVVNLTAEEPVVEMLVTSPQLTRQLAGHDADPKTGPLDRIFWNMSKTGQGKNTVYNVLPVKSRDLQEDWGVDVVKAEAIVDQFEPLTDRVISFSSRNELQDIADEVSSH